MPEWVLRAADQVDRIARSDPEYRDLAQQLARHYGRLHPYD